MFPRNMRKTTNYLVSVCLQHGFTEKDIIKLSDNENHFGCSPKVIETIKEQSENFSFYPDADVTLLRKALSEKNKISGECFIFGNGSFELISLIANTYIKKGDEAIYNDPSFGWYLNVIEHNDGKAVKVPVDENKAVDTKAILAHIGNKTKVIWLCNPNNPTGTLIPAQMLNDFIAAVPNEVVIVLDEAYADFIDGNYLDTVELVKKHNNIILLRTFSKAYGLASFRVGYGIASTKIIKELNRLKLPLNIGLVSQVAALVALNDEDFIEYTIRKNYEERNFFYSQFEKLGLKYIRSHGCFVLVEIGFNSSLSQLEFLKRGIIVHNGEEYGLPGWLRISIGKPEENRKVIFALIEILKNYN